MSSATRTWQTFARLYRDAPPPRARFLDALYHAGPETMLATLRGAREACVLMIGHNPGIADFATRLLAETPADPDYARYPTCATAVIDFPTGAWGGSIGGPGRWSISRSRSASSEVGTADRGPPYGRAILVGASWWS